MAKLIDVASRAMDLYFQDYADRKEFFDETDFMFHCATQYSKILNAMFQVARKENKSEIGFSNVDISAQWLVSEKFTDLKYDEMNLRYYLELKNNVFSFDFDAFGNGLNGIRPYGNSCNLKKISNQEIRFADIIPTTPDIYYFLDGKKRVDFLKKPTIPLSVYYIPEVLGNDTNCVMSDNIVFDVITATLQLMFGAKTGNVIKESDDGNRNAVLPQQVNPALTQLQK